MARIRIGGTHTYAILEVSETVFDEIEGKLKDAGYDDIFHEDSEYGIVIDMHGLAVAKENA